MTRKSLSAAKRKHHTSSRDPSFWGHILRFAGDLNLPILPWTIQLGLPLRLHHPHIVHYHWQCGHPLFCACVWAEAAEGSRGREQTEAGLHPHLVSDTHPQLLIHDSAFWFQIAISKSQIFPKHFFPKKDKKKTQHFSAPSLTATSPIPTRSRWPMGKWPQWTGQAPGPTTQLAAAEPARAATVSFKLPYYW